MNKISPTIQTIKAEMEERGWSAMKLAEEAGLNFQTVYRIFAGEFVPNFTAIEKMIAALGMRIQVKK